MMNSVSEEIKKLESELPKPERPKKGQIVRYTKVAELFNPARKAGEVFGVVIGFTDKDVCLVDVGGDTDRFIWKFKENSFNTHLRWGNE